MPTLPTPPPIDFARDALFLDFDGTLVELADRPEAVHVPAATIDALDRLSERLHGRLALVSGRAISVLDDFGMAGLACAGSHGAETRFVGGPVKAVGKPEGLTEVSDAFRAFADAHDGVLFEEKPLGAGLHFRLAPGQESAALALARELAERWNLHVQTGHAMVELRGTGFGKGDAIAAFLDTHPFAGYRPVFIGDDVTDEHGFEAVARAGGHGILVGPARKTAALYRLRDVARVNEWLGSSLGPMKA